MPGLVGINNPGIPLGGFAQLGPQRSFGRRNRPGQSGGGLFGPLDFVPTPGFQPGGLQPGVGGFAPQGIVPIGRPTPQLPQQQQLPGGILGQQNNSPFRRGVGTRIPGKNFSGLLG
jgi:hypothetical protein